MGKKRNIQPPPIMPGRIKVEIKDEIGNNVFKSMVIILKKVQAIKNK